MTWPQIVVEEEGVLEGGNSMKPTRIVYMRCALAAFCVILISGCSRKAEVCTSVRESQHTHPFDGGKGAKFTHWRWESKREGWDYRQGIMIGLDFNFSEVTTGTNHVRRTVATGWADRYVEWEIRATDAAPVEFTIDGTKFDLSKGSLFLVATAGGRKNIQQFDERLPDDTNELEAFAKTNAVVAKFIAEAAKK